MSDVVIRQTLTISKGNLKYQSQPPQFSVSLTNAKGPSPGALTVTTSVTNVDFSQLTRAGLCRITNLDTANYVEYGTHDGAVFHPLGEILPGEFYLLRLSRNLGVEEDVPGTGTTGVVNTFALRSNSTSCNVVVEGFDR